MIDSRLVMTFAEICIFILILVLLTFLLRPLQRYLEPRLRKLFKSKKTYNGSPVIDITDYSKSKKKDKEP